jgi:hypothetical protein
MIFFGRPLAVRPRVAVWQSHSDDSLYLNFIDQEVTVHLPAETVAELREALEAALAAAASPEAAKDRARRLQILRDRLALLARARGGLGEAE